MKELLQGYKNKKQDIKQRLESFRRIYKKGNRDIFRELCFCILTPQSKATICDKAIKRLQKEGLLFNGASQERIRSCLKGVRFPNNKAGYIVGVKNFFKNGKGPDVKSRLDTRDLSKTRDWLVKNVKGLGYKEASHFLRNIGFGKDLAILDRHIMKNLKRYNVINRIPASLGRKKYIEIEHKMKQFFKNIGITMEEIDLLFWSMETGFVFK